MNIVTADILDIFKDLGIEYECGTKGKTEYVFTVYLKEIPENVLEYYTNLRENILHLYPNCYVRVYVEFLNGINFKISIYKYS